MSSGIRTNQDLICIVKELRGNISDVIQSDTKYDDDFFLIQWLKRFSFKVDKTEAMLREALEWRKANDIDNLAQMDKDTTFPGLAKELPVSMDGRSKTGVPVFTFHADGVDFITLIKKYGKETFLRYIYCTLIKGEQAVLSQLRKLKAERPNLKLIDVVTNELAGNLNENSVHLGVVGIASFKDISLWNAKSPLVLSVLFEASKAGANYFPVFVNQLFFINANKVIYALFKIIKPIIASPYYPIDCFSLDAEKWTPVLLAKVDASQLSEEFGGKKI